MTKIRITRADTGEYAATGKNVADAARMLNVEPRRLRKLLDTMPYVEIDGYVAKEIDGRAKG